MLTKDDFKEIRKIVREEVSVETDDLKEDVKSGQMRVRMDIGKLDDRIKNLEIRIGNLEKNTEKGFKKTHQKFDDLIDFLDVEHLKNLKKIERIETHLGFTPTS
jgi:hypothetical protein